jgi:hypothetical protein
MPTANLLSALSDYLAATRRLLHDPAGALYTTPDLTEFINRAIRQRDLDLGINRVRLSMTLTAGVSDYPFATIASAGTVMDGSTNAILMDVMSIFVMPLGTPGSSVRYPLARWPFSKLSYLLSSAYPSYPSCYAVYGSSTIIMGPAPAQNYPAEFDFTASSPDLVNNSDTDIVPYPWTDPIPFLAASFAKVSAQRYDESESLAKIYFERMNRVRGRARSIAISSPWSDLPRR